MLFHRRVLPAIFPWRMRRESRVLSCSASRRPRRQALRRLPFDGCELIYSGGTPFVFDNEDMFEFIRNPRDLVG